MDRRVAGLIHRAPSLREITLKASLVNPSCELLDLMHLVGSNTPWQNVTTLGLLEFSCSWEQLVALILRYRDTLEYLEIGRAEMERMQDWAPVWPAIAGQLPRLKVVKIHELLARMGGLYWRPHVVSEVKEYIMTGPAFLEGRRLKVLGKDMNVGRDELCAYGKA